jgi:hypothetical protein
MVWLTNRRQVAHKLLIYADPNHSSQSTERCHNQVTRLHFLNWKVSIASQNQMTSSEARCPSYENIWCLDFTGIQLGNKGRHVSKVWHLWVVVS